MLVGPKITDGQVNRCATSSPIQRVAVNSPHKLTDNISIPIVFHVIYYEDGTGNVSDSQINDQINAMNNSYSNTGFSFYLFGITRTQNNTWFSMSVFASEVTNMTNSLATDPQHIVNVYIKNGGPYLGRNLNYPNEVSESSNQNAVLIDYGSLPDGYITYYNQGKTMVHEVGHYLGLYHTFEFDPYTYNTSCDDPVGDLVDDTPFHQANYSCQDNSTDSCLDLPGLDPIHNYLNYVTDSCMTEFTTGQINRMNSMVAQYKPNLGASVINISGDLTFYSDVIINNGITLNIANGTSIYFANGKGIVCNGSLLRWR